MENKIKEVLDFKELSKLFKNFALAVNIDVTLYDENGNELLFFGDSEGLCRKSGCTLGGEALEFASKKSFEIDSTYIFMTPCGLIKCVFPIAFQNSMVGFVTCGPVMLWDNDDFAKSEFENNITRYLLSENADISKVKEYDCERMTSIAEMLFFMVSKMIESQKNYSLQREKIDKLIFEKETLQRKTNMQDIAGVKYPADIERELITCVRLGNRKRATEIINLFLGEIFNYAGGDLDMIKMKLYEFVAFLSRSAVENGASMSKIKSLLLKTSEITNEKTDFHDLCYATTNALDGFLDLVEETITKKNKTVSHLENAIAVINEKYYENPTLESVAGEVAISQYYLSHLFKEKLSTTFVEYLTGVKIAKAKELLSLGKPIEEVSEAVGYNDANYFSKIFKSREGITPSKFKRKK